MSVFAIKHPVATLSRGIEKIAIKEKDSKNLFIRGGCALSNRFLSTVVFPSFLLLELTFKRIPKLFISIGNKEKFDRNADKISKYALSFLFSPLGLRSPEGIPGFFLKTPPSSSIRPFGVEKLFGKELKTIFHPKTIDDLKKIVKEAKNSNKQVSIVGSGMSQGTQAVPKDANQILISTKYLNNIEIARDGKTVKVGAGANWEEVQVALGNKSIIVKQASDIFSVGGSIGINCHGWAHEYGAISSTVKSLEIIDANGELRTLYPKDELFGCMFGTLGYFGVIVSATFATQDDEYVTEKMDEIDLKDFSTYYETKIKGKDIPLFGGRLVLDTLDGNPLRKVCMVRYEKDIEANQSKSGIKNVSHEPKLGKRIERIALKLISHLSYFSVKRLLSWLWSREKANMSKETKMTLKEALHPPINAFKMLHHSDLHTEWLQEYFIKKENLPNFLRFLGAELKANDVRLINATIRPAPKDTISILPYAEQDRFAVVLCFSQIKSKSEIAKTKKWIETVNEYVIDQKDVYYQAYMPYATKQQFEKAYGLKAVNRMRTLKEKYDPDHRFGSEYTAKYFDGNPTHNNWFSSLFLTVGDVFNYLSSIFCLGK